MRRDIFRHDASGSDDRVLTDCDIGGIVAPDPIEAPCLISVSLDVPVILGLQFAFGVVARG